eukprot:SAG31_NODE_6601_length_1956_cov_1.083468_1_plen_149_part_00
MCHFLTIWRNTVHTGPVNPFRTCSRTNCVRTAATVRIAQEAGRRALWHSASLVGHALGRTYQAPAKAINMSIYVIYVIYVIIISYTSYTSYHHVNISHMVVSASERIPNVLPRCAVSCITYVTYTTYTNIPVYQYININIVYQYIDVL